MCRPHGGASATSGLRLTIKYRSCVAKQLVDVRDLNMVWMKCSPLKLLRKSRNFFCMTISISIPHFVRQRYLLEICAAIYICMHWMCMQWGMRRHKLMFNNQFAVSKNGVVQECLATVVAVVIITVVVVDKINAKIPQKPRVSFFREKRRRNAACFRLWMHEVHETYFRCIIIRNANRPTRNMHETHPLTIQ